MSSDTGPDDVREQIQREAAKAAAAVGGFFEGIRDGLERGRVAEHARAAAESVVRVVREAAAAARDEFRRPPPR